MIEPRLVATLPDPAPSLAQLRRQRPLELGDRSWVVGRCDDVEAGLRCPHAVVDPPAVGDDEARLVERMARFQEGARHRGLRRGLDAVVERLDLDALDRAMRRHASRHLAGRDEVDLVPLAQHLPARVLAETMELPDAGAAAAAAVELVDVVSATESSARASSTTLDVLTELEPAALSLLFQCVDATAALLIHELLPEAGPPIVLTARRTTAPVAVGGTTIPPDVGVVVVLGVGDNAWFGHGRHACPGERAARTMASAMAAVIRRWGAPPDRHAITWSLRPNLRIPRRLVLTRRTGEDGVRDREDGVRDRAAVGQEG